MSKAVKPPTDTTAVQPSDMYKHEADHMLKEKIANVISSKECVNALLQNEVFTISVGSILYHISLVVIRDTTRCPKTLIDQ